MKTSEFITTPKRRSLRLAMKVKRGYARSKTKFLTLNDDCLDAICEWLPLRSLTALGSTCKRLNKVAENYFRLTHPASCVLLSSMNGKVNVWPNERYVQCFTDQFRNILIKGTDLNLLKYAATTFTKIPLKTFSFSDADCLTEAHITCVDGIIKNAEIIELTSCSSTGGLHEILKHCSSIKQLVLKSFTECKKYGHKYDWLLQQYPTLEHLHWGMYGTLPAQLATFFRDNPNVKSFYGTEDVLPFIIDHKIVLNTLILKVSAYVISPELIFGQLKDLCDRNAIESLFLLGELDGLNDYLPKLSILNGICTKQMTTFTTLCSLSHLKLINIRITTLVEAKQLAQRLNNLEGAYLEVTRFDFITPFIEFTPKLSTIYINNMPTIGPKPKLKLFELGKLRQNLTDITIYLKEELYLKIKCASIGAKSSSVQIKTIEAHMNSNPFVRTITNTY